MHSASFGGSRLQQQQQNGKRGEQWVPVQEHQSGSSSALMRGPHKIFANTVVAGNSAANSSESLSTVSPSTTPRPPVPAAVATFSPVDSAVAAALAPADAGGGGAGLSAGRRCSRSSLVASPATEGRACDNNNSASFSQASAAPGGTSISKGDKKGKLLGSAAGGETRAPLTKRTSSSSIIKKSQDSLRAAAESAKVVAGMKKKEVSSFSPESRIKEKESGIPRASSVQNKMKDTTTGGVLGSKTSEQFFKKRESSSTVTAEPPRPDSAVSSRRYTGESTDSHSKKQLPHTEMQQQKQQQKGDQKKQQSQQQDQPQRQQEQKKQEHKQKQQREVREWGDRTEEREILKAFQGLMGAELLHELPSFLQQHIQQQHIPKEKQQQHHAVDEGLCLFRLWGPHVEKCWVHIKDELREERKTKEEKLFEMLNEGEEKWGTVLRGVQQGTPYEFVLQSSWNDCFATEGLHLHRRDPYAREVDFDSTTCFVVDPSSFPWRFAAPAAVSWNRLVIYELHPGSFVHYAEDGKTVFERLVEKLDYIKRMQFNAVELLPVQEFGGEWGYNPRLLMAPHGRYGTLQQLQQFVDECHGRGLAVILDVVLNHGSSKLNSLWNWDGYGKDNSGGIYFEGGGDTGWGRKFAFQKKPIQRMILQAAARFLNEYKVDGLRVDSVHNMPWDFLRTLRIPMYARRYVHGYTLVSETRRDEAEEKEEREEEEGGEEGEEWETEEEEVTIELSCLCGKFHACAKEMTWLLREKFPQKILIAEITPENPQICEGGAGFNSCWIHATYYDAIKIIRGEESLHHVDMLRAMIDIHKGFSKSHQCVNSILGSHDQAGNKQQGFTNGKSGRYAVNLYGGRNNWHSRAQCRMWYSLQATSRGLPMMFMGTETCQDDWWNTDGPHSFNWQLADEDDVISQQMRSLVTTANELRLKHAPLTDDDAPVHFPHVDSHNRVLGFTRGNLLMVLNFSENQWDEASYLVNTDWRDKIFQQRFNSQSEAFGGWDGSWTAKNNAELHSSAAGQLAVKLPKWSVTVYEMRE